jgi:hypothetical protein
MQLNRLPDHHFLYLAPGAGVGYFFVAARRFWEAFSVHVIHDLDVVEQVVEDQLVAVTSLARSDTADMVREIIETRFGNAIYHDLLVYDFMEDVQLTLDIRVDRNEPLGFPLNDGA